MAGLKHKYGRWKHRATPADVIPNEVRDLLFAPSAVPARHLTCHPPPFPRRGRLLRWASFFRSSSIARVL